jgi:hypothetical protein
LIHLKLKNSEVVQRVDEESFGIAEILKKTLVFYVYVGCSGEGHVRTWAAVAKGMYVHGLEI